MDPSATTTPRTVEDVTSRLVRDILALELAERQGRDPAYSLRAFARDLAICPGDLSKVIRHKKFFSVQTVARLAHALQLDHHRARVLVMAASLRELESKSPH